MKDCVQPINPALLVFLLVAIATTGCGEPEPLHIPDTCHVEEIDDDCVWSNTDLGVLQIRDLEDLKTACASPCSKAQEISILLRDEYGELLTFSGFDFVNEVWRLSISVRKTQHFAAFANIEEVELIEIERNSELQTIEPFQRLERLSRGGLFLQSNPSLQDLTAFSNLRTIGHPDLPEGPESDVFLHLDRNDTLVDLRGLENLEYVHRIRITNNNGLESLKGLGSLEEVQSIYLDHNDNLASLEGLENLRAIHLGAFFFGNPNLRRCEIEALIDQLEITPNVVEIRDVSEEPCD